MTADFHAAPALAHFHQVEPMRLLALAALTALTAAPAADCRAQCCGQPTVAYSPVVAQPVATPLVVAAPAPERDRWYPGKFLSNLFGRNREPAPTLYNVGYAPAPAYTVGYAPAPTAYTASYAPTFQTAYRPTYPATYGQVAYAPAPVMQTVARPVALAPVLSAPACTTCAAPVCDACPAPACDACSYAPSACGDCGACSASPASGCSSCNAASYDAPAAQGGYGGGSSYPEPQPALPPDANVPPTRGERSIEVQKSDADAYQDEFNDSFDDTFDSTEGDPAASNDYFSAPPLFPPASNRVTRRAHPAPVRTAVYKRAPTTRPTAYREADRRSPAPRGKVNRLSADGWTSASN